MRNLVIYLTISEKKEDDGTLNKIWLSFILKEVWSNLCNILDVSRVKNIEAPIIIESKFQGNVPVQVAKWATIIHSEEFVSYVNTINYLRRVPM